MEPTSHEVSKCLRCKSLLFLCSRCEVQLLRELVADILVRPGLAEQVPADIKERAAQLVRA